VLQLVPLLWQFLDLGWKAWHVLLLAVLLAG
jgi:hypothetical protein